NSLSRTARMAAFSSMTEKTRRCGERSNSRANCSTQPWYRRMLFLDRDLFLDSNEGGAGRLRAINGGHYGQVAVGCVRGNLDGYLIQACESRRKGSAEHRSADAPHGDRDRAGRGVQIRRHLDAHRRRGSGGAEAGTPEDDDV